MSEVVKFANQIKLDTEKLLGDWIVCIPGFTLQKYRQLQRSKLSIFSLDCFGGLISNLLGLKILSPFFNLRTSEKEFLRFLKHPRVYLEEDLEFKKTIRRPAPENFDSPVYSIGNVDIWMTHYKNFDEAVAKWNERKQRINWYNLFAVMNTHEPEILEQFDALPYGKKVCFTSFQSNLNSAFYIAPKFLKEKTFGLMIGELAKDVVPFSYDVFDMLLYGKKTQLIEM